MAVKFFGQFLLDRGVIAREQLLAALALQGERNLPLGAYAVHKGYLTAEQADRINQAQRSMDERFGDLAVEMGLLTDGQVAELLTLQQNDHIRIGEALVELGHLDQASLDVEVAAFEADQAPFETEKVVFPANTPNVDFLAVAVDLTRKMLLRIARIRSKIASVGEMATMPNDELVTVSLSFTGALTSEFVLSTSRDIAEHVARSLIGNNAEVSEEVAMDALKELANIICGSTVGKLAQAGQRLDITPPLDGAPMVREGDKGVYIPLLVSRGAVEIRIANEVIA